MTSNELWDMLVSVAKRDKKFPKSETLSAYSKVPDDIVKKVYKRWMLEGKLEKKGDTFIFTDNAIQSEIVEDEERLPVRPAIKPSVRKKIEQQNSIILKVIKVVVGIIGTILTCVSIHFTFQFNKLGMTAFWGMMLSVSVVCFMAFAFTIKSYVNKRLTGIFIVILWVLGISYSVFTAVSGQFNDFRKYTASDSSVQVESKNKIYESQLKALEKKQTELLHWREQETEYSLNPDLKVENPVTWVKIQNGVEELREVESNITDVQEKLLNNINTDVVLEETVYNWLSSFLGISADIIQFIIILFPALFIDLCSTVCFTFTFGKENTL